MLCHPLSAHPPRPRECTHAGTPPSAVPPACRRLPAGLPSTPRPSPRSAPLAKPPRHSAPPPPATTRLTTTAPPPLSTTSQSGHRDCADVSFVADSTTPLTRPSRACCVVTLAAPLFAPLRPSWLSSALVYGLAGAPSRRLCVLAVLLRCFSRPAAGSCRVVLCPLPQLNRLPRQGLKTTTSGAVWRRRAGSWRLTFRPYPPSPPLSPGPSGADWGVVPPRGFESRHHGGRFRERPGDGTGELTCPPWDV